MRRLLGLSIVLSTLACHRAGEAPRPPNPSAELDLLIARVDGVAGDPRACDQLDAALANLAKSELGQVATYARAEAALRCGRVDRWQALHEQLARADYMPSLMRLANDAVEQGDWDRALLIVERIADRSDKVGERERMRQAERRIIHARWVDHGDPGDFARLERAAKTEIVRDPKRLEPRAALIRLYVEQAAIADDSGALILAQISEREARRVADELGLQSPALELVAGFVRELEGDRMAAIAAWTRALQLNAALVEPHLWLGLAALERRDPAAAQGHLRAFTTVHPGHVDALLILGVATHRLDQRDEARQIYSRVLELAPDDPRTHWYLALLDDPYRMSDADYDEVARAIVDFERSLRVFTARCDLLGPRACPSRGHAGPEPGCVEQADALARSCVDAGELAEAMRYEIEAIRPIHCTGPDTIRKLEAQERAYRERLLELERQAEAIDP